MAIQAAQLADPSLQAKHGAPEGAAAAAQAPGSLARRAAEQHGCTIQHRLRQVPGQGQG